MSAPMMPMMMPGPGFPMVQSRDQMPVMQMPGMPTAQLSPSLRPPQSSPPKSPKPPSNQAAYTMTQDGQFKQLQTVGAAPRPGQAGVGIFFQHEKGKHIYVASMVPAGMASRDGRIRIDDELVGINNYAIDTRSSLESVRDLVLGPVGTYLSLSFRRPGGFDGTGDRNNYWYFEVELERSEANPEGRMPSQAPNQPLPQRSIPPPQIYANEIANLRTKVNMLREQQEREDDPLVTPLKNALYERTVEMKRIQQQYANAANRLEASQRDYDEAQKAVYQLQTENTRLQQQDRERSARLSDFHRERGNQLGHLDNALGDLENELAAEMHTRQEYQRRIVEAEEEMAEAIHQNKSRSAGLPKLRQRLYEVHDQMLHGISAQEQEMQKLSDIIPALDMVHSSLISQIALDPLRLSSYQMAQPPKIPSMTTIPNTEGILMGSSLRGRGQTIEGQRQYVPVGLSASISGMSGSISGNISESLSKAVEEDLRSKAAAGSSSSLSKAVEEDLRSKHQKTLLSSSFSGRALGMSLSSSFPGRADHSMRLHGDDTQPVATHVSGTAGTQHLVLEGTPRNGSMYASYGSVYASSGNSRATYEHSHMAPNEA